MLDFIVVCLIIVTASVLGVMWIQPLSNWFDAWLDKTIDKIFKE